MAHNEIYLYFAKGTCQKVFCRFFSVKGGGQGYPPFPLRVFGQDDFLIRGGRGVPPNSAKENSAKKQV